ncbi:hypothetical protein ABTZ03_09670 [Kitasatospora sp. NPDC096077]
MTASQVLLAGLHLASLLGGVIALAERVAGIPVRLSGQAEMKVLL